MSRLAGLINKEKNRRIVSAMFSSYAPDSLSNAGTLAENPLSDHLVVLEKVLFGGGVTIDKARTDVLISELEAIANTLT
ncbi:MAG: hypothetical protein ACI9T9_000615 [Oleiphilaceae bacterium]|jgi:hypothetical protein